MGKPTIGLFLTEEEIAMLLIAILKMESAPYGTPRQKTWARLKEKVSEARKYITPDVARELEKGARR